MSERTPDGSSNRSVLNRRDYLALTTAGVASFAGCTGNGGNGNGGTQAEIPIASLCPLSGAGSPFGPGQQAGFNIAAEDVNEAGGTNKGTINPINRDSETKPSRAAQKLQTLISNEDIPAFVGTWSSGVSSTLAPIAADNQIFQMGNGTTSPLLAELGWRDVEGTQIKFMGRTSPNDAMQGIAMGRTLNDIVGSSKAAFLHVDNPYGAGLAETAKQAYDGEAVATIGVPKQVSDYSSLLDNAFEQDPDALVLVTYPPNGEGILKQWDRGGYGGTVVAAEALFLHDMFDRLADIMEGSYITTIRPEKTPSWNYFQAEMRKRDQEITTFSSHSYDALFLEALAIHKADELNGLEIARNIKSISRPPGEKVFAGSEGFQNAKDLLDDGEEIDYQGASSDTDLSCYKEPFNRFAINQIVRGDEEDPAKVETVQTIPADFFRGKVYSEELNNQFNCPRNE